MKEEYLLKRIEKLEYIVILLSQAIEDGEITGITHKIDDVFDGYTDFKR